MGALGTKPVDTKPGATWYISTRQTPRTAISVNDMTQERIKEEATIWSVAASKGVRLPLQSRPDLIELVYAYCLESHNIAVGRLTTERLM